jgi:dephospho-CoA kinase
MGAVIAAADHTLDNEGTSAQLKAEIRRVMKEMLNDG